MCGPAGSSSKPLVLSWKDERGGLNDGWVRERGLCGPPLQHGLLRSTASGASGVHRARGQGRISAASHKI